MFPHVIEDIGFPPGIHSTWRGIEFVGGREVNLGVWFTESADLVVCGETGGGVLHETEGEGFLECGELSTWMTHKGDDSVQVKKCPSCDSCNANEYVFEEVHLVNGEEKESKCNSVNSQNITKITSHGIRRCSRCGRTRRRWSLLSGRRRRFVGCNHRTHPMRCRKITSSGNRER